jgi:Mn-dependent DtxR family transcriptional regulator
MVEAIPTYNGAEQSVELYEQYNFGSLDLDALRREIGEKIYERHTVLTEMLVKMGVPREVAVEDACKLEHGVSDVSFEAIKKFAERL